MLSDRLRAAGGDWRAAWYSPGVLGGASLVGVYGAPPVFTLGAWMGLPSVVAYDVAVLATQAALGFLCAHASASLATGLDRPTPWSPPRRPGVGLLVLVSPVFAFAPIVGWRVTYGHLNLLWGATAFVAALALIAAARQRRVTGCLALVAFAVFAHAFTSHSFQLLLYSGLFGAPIALAVAWGDARGGRRSTAARALWPAALLVALALAVSWPKLGAMLRLVKSSDALRSGAEDMVYSYVQASARDWLSSLAWSHARLPSGRPSELVHETHLAFGPPLLLFLAMPSRRATGVVVTVTASLVVALGFASGVGWMSAPLLELPLVRAFRVPHRAVMVPALALLVIAAATLLRQAEARLRGASRLELAALCSLVALSLLPASWSGPLAWGVAIGAVVAARSSSRRSRPLALAAPVALAALSVGAFREKLPRVLAPRGDLVEAPTREGARIAALVPGLTSPVERLLLADRHRVFGINTAVAYGLSTIEGYGYPTRRFDALVRGVGARVDGAGTYFQFEPRTPELAVLGQLYDVRVLIDRDRRGDPRWYETARAAGPAWRSAGVAWVPTFGALGAALRAEPEQTRALARRTMLLVEDDPRRPALPALHPDCGALKVRAIEVAPRDASMRVSLDGPGPCPLTIATNYLETMRATVVRDDGVSDELSPFPAFGALVGLIVPERARTVVLRTDLAR